MVNTGQGQAHDVVKHEARVQHEPEHGVPDGIALEVLYSDEDVPLEGQGHVVLLAVSVGELEGLGHPVGRETVVQDVPALEYLEIGPHGLLVSDRTVTVVLESAYARHVVDDQFLESHVVPVEPHLGLDVAEALQVLELGGEYDLVLLGVQVAGHDVQGFEGVVHHFQDTQQAAQHHGRPSPTLLAVQHGLVATLATHKLQNVVHDAEYVHQNGVGVAIDGVVMHRVWQGIRGVAVFRQVEYGHRATSSQHH